jgi:cytoskeletal protein CcmA (bactofilin family)
MNMGQSVVIKGELSGGEDLTLDGRVEGKVSLPDHVLTVGANARLDAEILAKVVIILGTVKGNVTAKEKFELRAFHDYLWLNGNVPIALLRWEYLGLSDEIEQMDAT